MSEAGHHKQATPKPKGVLFDLDRTLTDRSGTLMRYADRFLGDFADRLDPDASSAFEAGFAGYLERVDQGGYNRHRAANLRRDLPWRNVPEEAEIEEHWARVFSSLTLGLPGLNEIVVRLRSTGIALGVVTNGPDVAQRRKLQVLGLEEALDTIQISEDLGIAKPDPRIFERALQGLKTSASETWFVGDHPYNDIEGARRLGMTTVWMREGTDWPADIPGPHYEIRNLMELAPLVGI